MDEKLRVLLFAAGNYSQVIERVFHEQDAAREEELAQKALERQKRSEQRAEAPSSPGKKKREPSITVKKLTAGQKRKLEADESAHGKRSKIVDEDKSSDFEQPATVTVSVVLRSILSGRPFCALYREESID